MKKGSETRRMIREIVELYFDKTETIDKMTAYDLAEKLFTIYSLSDYKFLGRSNLWYESNGLFYPPKEYRECIHANHELALYKIGQKHELWICKKCKIYWRTDTIDQEEI